MISGTILSGNRYAYSRTASKELYTKAIIFYFENDHDLSFIAIFFKMKRTKTGISLKNFFFSLSVSYTLPKFGHLNSGHPAKFKPNYLRI